jgi:hypothetical protein
MRTSVQVDGFAGIPVIQKFPSGEKLGKLMRHEAP